MIGTIHNAKETQNVQLPKQIHKKNLVSLQEGLTEYRFLLKPTIILTVIYLVGISSLLRANFYYIDDIARANEGYTQWEYYSRHLMVLFGYFLHADGYLTDVSPLPQFVAAIFMAIAGTISIYAITGKKDISVWHLIAAVPMGLSPYFLECFSYKYDSAVMGLSVLLSVAPLLLAESTEKKYALAVFLCTLCMCMSYQAAAGIYPVLVVFICFRRWLDGHSLPKVFRFAAISAAGYLAGLVIFRLFIMTPVSNHASSDLPAMGAFFSSVIGIYKKYLRYFLADFKVEWHLFVVVLGACFLYVSCRTAKAAKILTALLAVLVLLAAAALSLGVYPFLAGPTFYPRSMYGIGCTIAFLAIFIFSRMPKLIPAKVAAFLLSWCFFSFAFTYGNALYVQSQYTDYRIMITIDDLVDSGIFEGAGEKKMRITGSIGYAPVIRHMPQDFQILNRLVPINFQDSEEYWGTYGFKNYYGLSGVRVVSSGDYWEMDLPVIVRSTYHTICSDGEYIWLNLYE